MPSKSSPVDELLDVIEPDDQAVAIRTLELARAALDEAGSKMDVTILDDAIESPRMQRDLRRLVALHRTVQGAHPCVRDGVPLAKALREARNARLEDVG